MVEYSDFMRFSRSSDSAERSHAAHMAALAYLDHQGPADEHAALYASLIGFLDDPSVKVRAALAFGLLHAPEAPRPIIMALLRDSAVIARAILQHCPILLDADLIGVVREGDATALAAVAQREKLSPRIAAALVAQGDAELVLRVLRRADIVLEPALLSELAEKHGADAALRGALLARQDLPAAARLILVRHLSASLRDARIVSGALAPERLERLLRDSTDTAVSAIGESEAVQLRDTYVENLVRTQQLSTRVLLHAVVTGHVMFFADCIAELGGLSRDKVFTLLESGSRAALSALFARAGLDASIGRVLVRVVLHARIADLADDVAARHYVVTAVTEELILEHDGAIPDGLEEVFRYLSEQNIALARKAARGVMTAFTAGPAMAPPDVAAPLQLPAA